MFKAIITDDEPLARDVISVLLRDYPQIEVVALCKNGNEAVDKIQEHCPDLLFLDIQMPDLDGFGILKKLDIEALPVIIFVTAYDQFALKAFEVHALDYLLKPFDRRRFDQAMQHALTRLQEKLSDKGDWQQWAKPFSAAESPQQNTFTTCLTVRDSGRLILVKTENLDWIGGAGDYTELHLVQHNVRKVFLHNETLSALEKKLDPQKFVRIHRSSIVQIDRVHELIPHLNGEYFVILQDGTRLKLSRGYRENLARLTDQR